MHSNAPLPRHSGTFMGQVGIHAVGPLHKAMRWMLVNVSVTLFALGGASNRSNALEAPAAFVRCTACHGEQGQGLESTKAPSIAGRESWVLRRQLWDFQTRERGKVDAKELGYLPPPDRTQWMHPIAQNLTRTDIQELSRYLSKLPAPEIRPSGKGDPRKGRELYEGCARCHGKSGQGSRMRAAPRLTGQHEWYLFNQMRDFRMGWRGADSKNPHVQWMRDRMDVEDAGLQDLVSYIASLNLPRMK